MKALLESQGMWFTVKPGIQFYQDIMEDQVKLETAVQMMAQDTRPGARAAYDNAKRTLEGFKAVYKEAKDAGDHADQVIASRPDIESVRIPSLSRYRKNNYNSWAHLLRCCMMEKEIWYVIKESDEENEEGHYTTPHTTLRDRDDASARFIISTALTPDQLAFFIYEHTAKKMWTQVQHWYGTR